MLAFSLAILLPLFQQGTLDVNCGAQNQDSGSDVIRCSGGASVAYQDVRVEADWMEVNRVTYDVRAGDAVRFVRGEEKLSGSQLNFNLRTRTGSLTEVSGQIEGFYVKAGMAERRENGVWDLSRIDFTSCDEDCPSWNFTFREASVTPGDQVTGKGVVFRFQTIPLLYLPGFRVPTESRERSSGFLIPNTSTSTTKGRSVRGSYYWAINRSYDATFTGEYFSKRGPAGTVDFRAAPRQDSLVDVSTFFAIDRKDQGGVRTRIRSYSDFGEGWRGVAKVDITSSFPFRQVFEEGFNLISSPIEQSTAFATRNRPHSSLSFLYNRDAVFFPDQPSTALRKFPAADLQLPARAIGQRIPVYFSFDGGVTGMARRDSQVSTPAFMQRVDVHPSIEIPLVRSSLLTWSHEIGVRETLYTHSIRSGVTRQVLNRGVFDYTTRLIGPQLEKDYGSWRHIIEPTAEYRYVAGVDEFRNTIIVDETDLVADTSEIEYGITNRFIGSYEFLTWRIAQKLYFDPRFGGALLPGRRNTLEPLMDLTGFAFSDGEPRRFSPLVSTVRIATTPQTSTDIEVDYDTVREQFRSAGIMGGLGRGPINATIGYFFNKRTEIQEPSNQVRGLVTLGSTTRPGFNAGFGFYYDIHRSLFQGSTAQVVYNSRCYGLSFEFTQYDLGVRKESRLRFSLSLKNIGSLGTLSPEERLF